MDYRPNAMVMTDALADHLGVQVRYGPFDRARCRKCGRFMVAGHTRRLCTVGGFCEEIE